MPSTESAESHKTSTLKAQSQDQDRLLSGSSVAKTVMMFLGEREIKREPKRGIQRMLFHGRLPHSNSKGEGHFGTRNADSTSAGEVGEGSPHDAVY